MAALRPFTTGGGGRLLRRRAGSWRRSRIGAVLLASLLSALAPSVPAESSTATTQRPFSADSPINQVIRSNPLVDPDSAAMVAYASRTEQVNANLYEFGIPIFSATPSTPVYDVSCAKAGTWGSCPFLGLAMRIPPTAKPNPGSDGAMTVVDTATETIGEYWQAVHTGNSWSASWGAVNSSTGSGWGGASTGAGASRLAGVIRVREIAEGLIPHALVLQTDNVCRSAFRPPAIKTDGDSTRADCIPEGTRLQLDPSIHVDSIAGITAGERAVARAMQVYGGYVIDRAGTAMSVSFEQAADSSRTTPGAVYTRAGLSWDYYGMPHVPWSRLRALDSWNG